MLLAWNGSSTRLTLGRVWALAGEASSSNAITIFFMLSSPEQRQGNGCRHRAIARGRQMQAVAGIVSRRQMIGPRRILYRGVKIDHRVEMAAYPGIHCNAVSLGDGLGMIRPAIHEGRNGRAIEFDAGGMRGLDHLAVGGGE